MTLQPRSTRTAAVLMAASLACLSALAGMLAFGAAPAHAATAHSVQISNYAFAPQTITVHLGDSLTWTNHDTAPHNIVTTTAPASINGPMMTKGQSWSYTFTKPGTYSYICGVHPDMHATVIVVAAPHSAAPTPLPTKTHATSTPVKHSATPPASTASMPAMDMSPTKSAAAPVVVAASTSVAATPALATPTDVTVAPVQASGVTTARLKPLLLVAGVIAAITVFCLLALAPRPTEPSDRDTP